MGKRTFSNNRERFIALAEARTNVVLHKIKVLGNCSNKNLYDYSEEEVKKIFNAIEKILDETRNKFLSHTKKTKFKL